MALAPLKARTTPSRVPFAPLLSVDLIAREAPPAAPRFTLAEALPSAPAQAETAPTLHRVPLSDAPPAVAAANPAPVEKPRHEPLPLPAGEPTAPAAQPAPNPALQQQDGLRLAVPDEVSVRVQLLSYEGGAKPQDTVEVLGKTYTYFKAPVLRRAARPLDDIQVQYPAQKPSYPHGAVKLQLLIDEEGKLEQANVMCSNPDFEKSALASVAHLRFNPAQAVTGPVKSFMVVEFGYGRGFPCAPVPDLTPSR